MKQTHSITYRMYIDNEFFRILGAESDHIDSCPTLRLFWEKYYNKINSMVTPELIEEAKKMAIEYVKENPDSIYPFNVMLEANILSMRWGTNDYSSIIPIYTHNQ